MEGYEPMPKGKIYKRIEEKQKLTINCDLRKIEDILKDVIKSLDNAELSNRVMWAILKIEQRLGK